MKLVDAWRLGSTNLRLHKGRSLAAVITISLMFGLILGINFLLTGVTQSLLPYARETAGGKIYIVSYMRGQTGERVMRARQEKYHGKVVGELVDVEGEHGGHVYYMPAEVLAPWIEVDLETLESGKAAIMMTQTMKKVLASGSSYGQLYDLPEDLTVEVGTLPEGSTMEPLRIGESQTFHPLNYILYGIASSRDIPMVVVEREGTWRPEATFRPEDEAVRREIVEFDNAEDAYSYLAMQDEAEFNYNNQQAEMWEIFSEQAQVYGGMKRMKEKVMVLEVVFAAIAAVIMTLTFAHLLDQDVQMMALYRALGATTGDVVKITTCYLVQMCLLALMVATVIGAVIAGVVSVLSAGGLQAAAEAHYGVVLGRGMVLIGLDVREYAVMVGLMLLMVPVALLLTADRLSGKRLATRLKRG